MVDMALKLDKKPAYPYGCPCGGGGSPRCRRAKNPWIKKHSNPKQENISDNQQPLRDKRIRGRSAVFLASSTSEEGSPKDLHFKHLDRISRIHTLGAYAAAGSCEFT